MIIMMKIDMIIMMIMINPMTIIFCLGVTLVLLSSFSGCRSLSVTSKHYHDDDDGDDDDDDDDDDDGINVEEPLAKSRERR